MNLGRGKAKISLLVVCWDMLLLNVTLNVIYEFASERGKLLLTKVFYVFAFKYFPQVKSLQIDKSLSDII